jgi:shikimate kinase
MSTKPICIMGFMGAGKTRWGKKLANKLGLSFVDLDAVIETKEGMSVQKIFELKGEEYFRKVESACLEKVLQQNDLVISLGGGTPCSDRNLKLLKQESFTVYLKSNSGMLHNRLTNSISQRPLIAKINKENLLAEIEKMLNEREKFYSRADVIVDVNGLTIQKLVTAVQTRYA